jgi:hypothetical protein
MSGFTNDTVVPSIETDAPDGIPNAKASLINGEVRDSFIVPICHA